MDSFYPKQAMVKYSSIQCKDFMENGGGIVPNFVEEMTLVDQVMLVSGMSHKDVLKFLNTIVSDIKCGAVKDEECCIEHRTDCCIVASQECNLE